MTRSISLTPTRILLATLALLLAGIAGFVAARPASTATQAGLTTGAAGASTAQVPTLDDIALAADTTPAQLAANRPIRGFLGLIGRTNRAEITVTTAQGTKTILYVHGVVSAVSGTSLTMTLPDGSTQVFAIDSTTVLRDEGATQPVSTLTTGERAMVFGLKNADGSYTAKLIRCVKSATTAPVRPNASQAPAG